MQEGLGPESAVCVRICQGSLAAWSRELDHQRTRALISLAVLRSNDRTSVKENNQEVRGQKWHQRCDSRIEAVWMCCGGRNQRKGEFWVLG